MLVKYIDEEVLKCIREEKIVEKSPAVYKKGKTVSRYFNIPLTYQNQETSGDFKDTVKIQGNEFSFQASRPFFQKSISIGGQQSHYFRLIPSVLYKTDKHIIITPNQQQFMLLKIINSIVSSVTILFFIFDLLFSFVFGPIFFISSLLFLLPIAISFFLFFFKKSYILISPLSTINTINKDENTILIKGRFSTGIPSLLFKDIEAELFLGDNIKSFE